ncbi:MAG: c-type cytochrome, partial [Acidobacteriota bacterium]|nr:c-type cytochrome [Acidobacteriota bacterium]
MSVKYFSPALLMVAASSLIAQHVDADRTAEGRRLFEKACTSCHGQNAKGGRGPDLTGRFHRGALESEIMQNIMSGVAGTEMPAFPMPEEEARSIVAYLKSLSAAGPDLPITGNAVNGQRLFFAEAGCVRCHMYRGEGGRLGPDLSRAGEAKSVRELRAAITQPHKDLVHGFETMAVTLRSGRAIRGIRKNEDTFSIQLMDEQEKLHMLLKKDLADFRLTGKSLMPEAPLNGAKADDVIAFLKKAPQRTTAVNWKPSADFNVSFERLKASDGEPQNWLGYWGDLRGTHYSGLKSVTPANVASLASVWTYQFAGSTIETTPLVVDGIMFVTGSKNSAAALDARTGRPIWRYSRRLPPDVHSHCTVMTNRGFAVLGDRLYMATLDAHLLSLDAKTGNVIWDIAVDDYKKGTSITHAPLAIDGKIIVGITAGECALTGFVDAYDAASGKKLWRIHTTPAKG